MIYFDAGATTLEKPAAVGRAMARAAHTMSSPGRGSYPASHLAEETAYLCRQEAAELLGVPQPENVVITGSATHGLNLAIRSLLGPGDRVVISGYEHNAVTRPLHAIPGLSVTVIDTPPFRPDLAAEEFCRAIRQKRPRAVICTHVSNVFGAVLPVEDIARCWRADRRADTLRRVALMTCHAVSSTTTARPIHPAVRICQKSRMVKASLYMPR